MNRWSLVLLTLSLTGCAQQTFKVVSADSPDAFGNSRYVVDVIVGPVSRGEHMDIVFGESRRQSAELWVEHVIKGPKLNKILVLRDFREMSSAERESIPGGIKQGTRLRIGFDRITGERLVRLKIAARPP